jgi:hypothetical protein
MARGIADTYLAAAVIALFGLPCVLFMSKRMVEGTREAELRRWNSVLLSKPDTDPGGGAPLEVG